MFLIFQILRVEIIRLSDKSFKETIKDVELSSFRSTTKEGYVSLDPSKPLPHEYEEGKLSRYNDNNLRQKYVSGLDINDQHNESTDEHEAKIVSKYANANDSVLLNKTEFREILMSALNINSSSITSDVEQMENSIVDMKRSNDEVHQSNHINNVNIETTVEKHVMTSTDDIVYVNQTIEPTSHTSNDADQTFTTAKSISSLDTPEVDKLLNEGKF